MLLKIGMIQKELIGTKDIKGRVIKTERDQMRKEDLSLNQMENEYQDQDPKITQEAKAVHHQGLLRHKLQDIGLDFPELEYLSFERNNNE